MNESDESHDSRIERDFIALNRLLEDSLGEIATARGSFPLESDEEVLLERMAEGDCDPDERQNVIQMLLANSEAMAFFADALKGEETGKSDSLT